MKKYIVSKYLASHIETLKTTTPVGSQTRIVFNANSGQFVIYNGITRQALETGTILFTKVEIQKIDDDKSLLESDNHLAVN